MENKPTEWDLIAIRVTKDFKKEYKQLCKSQASSISQMSRALIETYMTAQKQSNP
jgi:mRNA-degrading endonuclease RelE of RelBE toxin-antitoxin system